MRGSSFATIASVLGTAAAGSFLYGLFRRDLARAARAARDGALTVTTDRGEIEYGHEGSGPPVLVIHGAGGGFDQGLMLGRELVGPGHSLIAPSRFGYLGTPVPADGSHAAQADAHVALLDAIGVDHAVAIGVSAGAPSAIELALRHPGRVTGLILAVPRAWSPETELSRRPFESERVFRAVESGGDLAYWAASRVARGSVVHFLGVPEDVEARAPREERRRVTELIRSIMPLSRRVAGIRNDGEHDVQRWPLERIRVPTLVISAVDDLYGTLPCARFTAAAIPGAELMTLPSGGHLMVGQGAAVRGRIHAFLSALPARFEKAA